MIKCFCLSLTLQCKYKSTRKLRACSRTAWIVEKIAMDHKVSAPCNWLCLFTTKSSFDWTSMFLAWAFTFRKSNLKHEKPNGDNLLQSSISALQKIFVKTKVVLFSSKRYFLSLVAEFSFSLVKNLKNYSFSYRVFAYLTKLLYNSCICW